MKKNKSKQMENYNAIMIDKDIFKKYKEYCKNEGLMIGKTTEKVIVKYMEKNSNR